MNEGLIQIKNDSMLVIFDGRQSLFCVIQRGLFFDIFDISKDFKRSSEMVFAQVLKRSDIF